MDSVSLIAGVGFDDVTRQLEVRWRRHDVIVTSRYPFTWLRDSCNCASCYHRTSSNYKIAHIDLNVDCRLTNAEVVDDGVRLTWSDGHITNFSSKLLERVEFANRPAKLPRSQVQLWDSNLKISRFSFAQVMKDDMVLYDWIRTLWTKGLCLVTDAPKSAGQIHEIARRVGYLRWTQFGETYQLMMRADPSCVAFTPVSLGLHTDLPYYKSASVVQMLHCISQTKTPGGANMFADGFRAAEKLRTLHPEHFRMLTSVPVDFYDVGNDFVTYDHRNAHPIIQLDEQGERVEQITFSSQQINKLMLHRRVPLNDVDTFYRALRNYLEILHHPDNLIEYKLAEGEIVCFHNTRVLHGRQSFTLEGDKVRHLEVGYINWDEMLSRARTLRRQNTIDFSDDEDDPDLAATYTH